MNNDPVVIVGLARTPMGGFQGELKGFAAPELGAAAIRAAVERAQIKPEDVQEAIMGCVLPAGQGQAPARQAALGGGLPLATGCTTVNKMCGSGMKAAMIAFDSLNSGSVYVIVAGGMESMTNAPYLLPKARAGLRMGHGPVIDDWPAALAVQRRYLEQLARDVRSLIARGVPMATAAQRAAQDEKDRWRLFEEYNARNATAAFAELEWE